MIKAFHKMIGNTYLYKGSNYVIQNIEVEERNLFKVTTDKRVIRVNGEDLRKEFLPVEPRPNKKNMMVLYNAMQDNLPMQSLSTTLMDTIKKIQEDPKYIDQARAINETAKNLIEMQRVHVEMVRTIKDLS